MKKVLSLLLSFILLLAVVPVGTISAGALEDDVIEIRTIAELYNINNNMSGNFKLMNDIDMTQDTAVSGDWDFMGNGWEPIGSDGIYSNTAFTGTFDGNGHKIIGMRIEVKTKPSGADTVYLGLFANNAGTIKNFGIDETSTVEKGTYTGGICATNSGTILNCYNKAAISSGAYYSGGICGINSGDISNCYNESDVSANYFSGGICGYSKIRTINDCHNNGDITGVLTGHEVFSGGICGFSESGSFMNCYNNGSVSSSVNQTNSTSGSNLSECSSYSGGICGKSGSVVVNCFNSGSISSSANNELNIRSTDVITAYSKAYCGGICGISSNNIICSYNTGELSTTGSSIANNTYRDDSAHYSSDSYNTYANAYSYAYMGGVCGKQTSKTISSCYNTAGLSSSVEASAKYYGLHGTVWNKTNPYVVYSYNTYQSTGTTSKTEYLGGIVGESNGEINGCYNVGQAIFGIQGEGSGSVSNSYYLNGSGNSNTGAKALTNAQLQLKMCMPNFDFENTWVIYKETEYKYPQLRENLQEKEIRLLSIDVTMPDKTSYLVGEEFDPSGMTVVGHYDDGTSKEITNYEISGFTGELGRNDIIVTVGEKSSVFYVTVHNEGEWTTVKEPTCTEKGEKKLYCTDCGDLLDTEEIPAKGHTEVTDARREPTCTENGLTEGSHCSVCNAILTEQEVIPAKGHTPYLNWETVKAPTCVIHGEKVRYCSVCGEVAETMDIDVTDHQPAIDEAKEATCLDSGLTEGSHCSVCHTVLVPQEVIQPKGHVWDEGEIIINPTCTTTGEKVYHCKNCGQTKSETIPIRGHQPSAEWTVVKEATTTEAGLEELHCQICGAVLDSRDIPILSGDDSLTVTANSNYFPSKTFTNSNGEQFITVDYKLKSTAPLMNSQWELSYDTSKLKFVSATMPNVDGFAYDESSAGLVKGNFSTLNFANFSTEKDFAKATYKILGSGTTTTNFDVKVLGVRYNGTNKYPVDNGTAQTVSGVTVTRNTTISGNNVMLGDVNGDKVVDILDATLIQKHAVEKASLTDKQKEAADVNDDGIVDIFDATDIQKFTVEKITEFKKK